MDVKREGHFVLRRSAGLLAMFAAVGAALVVLGGVLARAQNSSSAQNAFWGSVTAQPVTGEPLKLTLDDAIQRGLKNNLGLREVEDAELTYHAQKNEALQLFLPTITLTA